MNDSEFFELLNLYLDHEISPANAARLEAEVQNNPSRRRIYQQYCRMQKACKVIAADFQNEPAESGAPERKIIAFNPAVAAANASRRRRINALYTFGSLAAAACVALVLVNRTPDLPDSAPAPVAVQATAVPPASAASTIANPDAAFVASKSAAPRGLVSVAPRPQLVRNPLLLTGATHAEALFATAVDQADSQLAWLESIRLAPVQQRSAADLHFAATLQTEGRALGTRAATPVRQTQPAEEMVTFKFMK